MKVKELIEKLKEMPEDSLVLYESDYGTVPITKVTKGVNECDGAVFLDDSSEEDWEPDWCYECTGYGDDFSFDADGDLVSNCSSCIHNRIKE